MWKAQAIDTFGGGWTTLSPRNRWKLCGVAVSCVGSLFLVNFQIYKHKYHNDLLAEEVKILRRQYLKFILGVIKNGWVGSFFMLPLHRFFKFHYSFKRTNEWMMPWVSAYRSTDQRMGIGFDTAVG